MLDPVGNAEDRFSHKEDTLQYVLSCNASLIESFGTTSLPFEVPNFQKIHKKMDQTVQFHDIMNPCQ